MNFSLSIVIPVYNEAARITKSLEKIIKYFERDDYEILIIDDGSSDRTLDIVRSFRNNRIRILRNEVNLGKGYSVKKGVLAATKSHILFSDADLSTPIAEFEKFKPYLKSHDILIGSRAMTNSDVKVRQPIYKVILGRLGNLMIRLLAVKGIQDTQCGFKLFNRQSKKLFTKSTIYRWGFDFEILYIAQKQKLNIKEIPVVWVNDPRSKVKKIDYLITFYDLIKIRINNILGKYK
ncbi:MAG: dolichyl-phosphate beta-glucosyltransferase [Patescibacteria group bacterium]